LGNAECLNLIVKPVSNPLVETLLPPSPGCAGNPGRLTLSRNKGPPLTPARVKGLFLSLASEAKVRWACPSLDFTGSLGRHTSLASQ